MIAALLLVPTIAGISVLLVRRDLLRRVLLIAAAATQFALTVATWLKPVAAEGAGWLALDDLARLFLTITSSLFLAAAVYAVGYLKREGSRLPHNPYDATNINEPDAVFMACLLLFLATMTLMIVSRRFGLIWVAMEATTLTSAPLIYFHRSQRSLEATWKYLLICSVGIALALLGTLFLAVAATSASRHSLPLLVDILIRPESALQPVWLKAAFIFLLVGYGTKMGLVPLHTWLPDAHSEAPSVVSGLLSGALLNCALLGIVRVHQVCAAHGLGRFSGDLLVLFGLLSMAVAGVFIAGQADFKRMLAYSSVEHMGILALGIGAGGAAVSGALFHALNHSMAKTLLFFAAGNIIAAYATKKTREVTGLIHAAPRTGVLWLVGCAAIVGMPPFSTFLSEFSILKALIEQGRVAASVVYLAALALVFVGMAIIMVRMALGAPPARLKHEPLADSWLVTLPPVVLGIVLLVLGVYVPPAVQVFLSRAAHLLGGR